jgi:hypothetical protein
MLRLLAEAAATALETFCATHGLAYANERDHFAPCCRTAVARITADLDERPALSPYAFGAKHGWVGLGSVDLVVRWPKRAPAFLELKCGAGAHVLRPCVWDAVKLATAVHGGNAGAGYLLAGAPAPEWAKPIAGAEFFDTAEWHTLGPRVRDKFRADWRFWASERSPHIPGRVPHGFSTVAPAALN